MFNAKLQSYKVLGSPNVHNYKSEKYENRSPGAI